MIAIFSGVQIVWIFTITVIPFLSWQDIGAGKGKYYAVNFPLRDGIDDDAYETIFKPVLFLVELNWLQQVTI